MKMDLDKCRTIIFDCDGVILDSNRIKTQAFRMAAHNYGDRAAQALVDYHIAHGGVSRYVKFAYFLNTIVPEYAPSMVGPGLEDLLMTYADTVRSGLMSCTVASGLLKLRAATPKARWLIVSGGDQLELREIFIARGIAQYFDGGIFGSPDSKDAILAREIEAGNIRRPAIFLGDSRFDREAAVRAELNFVFVSNWSEWREGMRLATEGDMAMVRTLGDFLET